MITSIVLIFSGFLFIAMGKISLYYGEPGSMLLRVSYFAIALGILMMGFGISTFPLKELGSEDEFSLRVLISLSLVFNAFAAGRWLEGE